MAMSSDNVLNAIKETAAANTAQSQAFAREQMKFNAEQAALDRAWQENMSNTAHQREVKDLLAAGLNPILSTGGNGASTPSGASAVGASGQVDTSYASALAGYASTLVSSAAQVEMARLSSAATLGAAATSAAASRYGSDRSASAVLGSAGLNLMSNIAGANITSDATRYTADQHKSASIWSSVINGAFNLLGNLAGNVTFGGKVSQIGFKY